jgi:hypothetical protein
MNNPASFCRLIYGIVFILIFSGCTQFKPVTSPLLDKKAFLRASQAKAFNQDIVASKGKGWAKIETKTTKNKFRMVWACVFPNKIRITFLLSGLPVETIVATGKEITFFSHTGEHSKISYQAKDPDMENYIQVPIKLSEMILILLGRFPLNSFDSAYFLPPDPYFSNIALNRNWKGVTQYLHFNDPPKIDLLVSMGTGNKVSHEMVIDQYKRYGYNDIPVKIELKNMQGRKLTLEITDFVPNPPIKASIFRLTDPG